MHVVVSGAVHHEKADVTGETGHVGDGGVFVAVEVVLGGVHVAFCVDRVWESLLVLGNDCRKRKG
jgi:hypothetical protein